VISESAVGWINALGPQFSKYVQKQPGVSDPATYAAFSERVVGLFRRISRPSATLIASQSKQLVVGSVQSGKTGTFIGATVLAAENGFEVSVVLAGRLTLLMNQTLARICEALVPSELQRVGRDGAKRAAERAMLRDGNMSVAVVPTAATKWKQQREAIAGEIVRASKAISSGEHAHVVLVCLKTNKRLESLGEILRTASLMGGLKHPGLLIDDECDEASLNTYAAENVATSDDEKKHSAVYKKIATVLEMHQSLHALFFTATPQANLLLDISDTLSPQYVCVLKDSPDYVGADELLIAESQFLQQEIPIDELYSEASLEQYPPDSLREAIAYFLWTAVLLPQAQLADFAAMLVHPSRLKNGHRLYLSFCERILHSLQIESKVLGRLSQDSVQLLLQSYELLPESAQSLGAALRSEVQGARIPDAMRRTIESCKIQLLNSDSQAKAVVWEDAVPTLLVGGDVLGRGFTVENLTTTYMPRGKSGGVDTNLQRCRFFGYRRPYLPWLRGWMDSELSQSLVNVAYGERALKVELERADAENQPLRSFRRVFLLDPGMSATRANVISLPYRVTKTRKPWAFVQRYLLDDSGRPSGETYSHSQIDEIVRGWLPVARDARELSSSVVREGLHRFVDISLDQLIQLLEAWPVGSRDVSSLNACSLQLAASIREPEQSRAIVVLMSPSVPRWRSPSNRSYASIGDASFTLMQGRQQRNPQVGDDSSIFQPNAITVQLHKVRPRVDATMNSVMQEVPEKFGTEFVYGIAVRLVSTFDIGVGTP